MYHGYYYGFDTTYLLLVVPALLIALIAQIQVKSAFSRYARVRCTSGLPGAQADCLHAGGAFRRHSFELGAQRFRQELDHGIILVHLGYHLHTLTVLRADEQ